MKKTPNTTLPPHPIQPLHLVDKVLRFRANAIVRHLLDHGGIDMNMLATLSFSREDREQFAQLIGYSHSGSADLGYMSDEVWEAARKMYDDGVTEDQARIAHFKERLAIARDGLRKVVPALFRMHPDDLVADDAEERDSL